jgi:tellurite resistance protein TehA-like permease
MEKVLVAIVALAIVFAFCAVGALVVMYTWNLILVPWLDAPKLGFWLAFLVLLALGFIFKR